MRKLLLTTAAVAAAIGLAVAGEPSFGTFTDNRDGQKYKTVKMPDGKTWMAQNINYKTKGGSWCYEDKADNCKKYGRLYDWSTAKKACPTRWHLPSLTEWDSLGQTVGGNRRVIDHEYIVFVWEDVAKKFKAESGWDRNGNGTDDYGFSALPSGYRSGFYCGVDTYMGIGYSSLWWMDGHDRFNVQALAGDVTTMISYPSFGYSVRCIADPP